MATGAGKDSNINIEGSDISGKQGTTLVADNQVNIRAAEQNHQERSTNKSSGFNAGVPKNKLTGVASDITTVVAIPVSAPFALSDVLSSDTFELLMKIGGNKNEKVFDDISIIPSWLLLA